MAIRGKMHKSPRSNFRITSASGTYVGRSFKSPSKARSYAKAKALRAKQLKKIRSSGNSQSASVNPRHYTEKDYVNELTAQERVKLERDRMKHQLKNRKYDLKMQKSRLSATPDIIKSVGIAGAEIGGEIGGTVITRGATSDITRASSQNRYYDYLVDSSKKEENATDKERGDQNGKQNTSSWGGVE